MGIGDIDLSAVPEERREELANLMDVFGPEELRADLKRHVMVRDEWVTFHHPLRIENFYHETLNRMINRSIAVKEQAIAEAQAERRWTSVLGLHERPYRMDAFKKLEHQMTDEEFWAEVSWLWTDSENIWQHLKDWRRVWRSKRPGRDRVMDDDERARLAALPSHFTVYRGTYMFIEGFRGLSWTLNRDKAVWFAYRYKPAEATPWLISGKISKRSVLALFDGRTEDEIVVFPERLKDTKVDELPMQRERKS